LAELAEGLGRRFEARGWWTIAARHAPDAAPTRAALARLEGSEPARGPAGRTLADVLGDLMADPATARPPGAAGASGAAPRFVDGSEPAGLRFVFDHGPTSSCQLPEIMGGGIALLDYDGDGWLDVYCPQGGPFPPRAVAHRP